MPTGFYDDNILVMNFDIETRPLEVDDTWPRKSIVAPDQRAEKQYDQTLGTIKFWALFFCQYRIFLNGVLVALQENVNIFSFWDPFP